jgi:hypothetical protein
MTVAAAAGTDERFLAAQRAAWASLPMSLTPVAGTGAELVVVDGAADGWLGRLEECVQSATGGVLLSRPRPGPPGHEVRRAAHAARDAGVAIVVDRGWAAHPAVTALAESGPVEHPALLDSVVTVPVDDGRPAALLLLEQLALVRAVLGPVATVEFGTADRRGYSVSGRRGGCVVALAAVRSAGAARARLTAYAAGGEVHIEVADAGTAAPATAWRVDGRGQAEQPTRYESGVRASWLRLVTAVRGKSVTGDLAALADDLDLVATVATLEP